MLLEVGLQALEGDHDDSDVVKGLLVEGQLHDIFDCLSAKLMQCVEGPLVSFEGVPNHLDDLSVR